MGRQLGMASSLWASASSSVHRAIFTSVTPRTLLAQPVVGSDSGWTTLKLLGGGGTPNACQAMGWGLSVPLSFCPEE